MKSLRQQLKEAQDEVARLKKMTRCPRAPLAGWLGGIIQKRREANGWTLNDLSRRSDVAVGLLSRVESNAKANPTLNNLLKIAAALNVPLSALVTEWEADIPNSVLNEPTSYKS